MDKKRKRRFGDRKDGYRLRGLDDLHVIMPYIMPKRTDNEAVLIENFEIEKALSFIEEKNKNSNDDFKYTIFHFLLAAFAKTVYHRPKLNYFIAGRRMFERNEISMSFVVKKKFEDDAHEALAKVVVDSEADESLIEQMHEKIKSEVFATRKSSKVDGATKKMGKLSKMPRFILKIAVGCINLFDYFGWLPNSFTSNDPDFSSIFVTNLGSIKMNADYHHLANYGTNSFFLVIGEMKNRPIFKDDGTFEMKKTVKVSITIDERIADGVYFAKSIRFLRHIIANPQLLDEKISNKVDCDLDLN